MTSMMKRLETSSISPVLPPKKRRLWSASSSSSSVQLSAEIIEGHDDLLLEILVLLPAKSLLRFKSVSKHWDSLISNESFQRRHLLHRRPETQHSFILGIQDRSQYFICHPTIKKLVRFSLPCTFPHVKILQSSHGLLLLDCGYKERGRRYYFVFNPMTKQFRNIYTGRAAAALSLIFDPSKSEYYRVIGIWKNRPTILARFSLYSSDTHEWTSGTALPVCTKFTDVLSCKNCAYFISSKHSSVYYSGDHMGFFPCDPMAMRGKNRCIMESNGYLHCVNVSFSQNKPHFYISEMIDNEWSVGKKSTVSSQLQRVLEETRGQMEFLGMIREERMEDSIFLVHVPGQIIISRFCDEVCEVLVDYRNDHYFYQEGQLQFKFKDAHPFIESFASV